MQNQQVVPKNTSYKSQPYAPTGALLQVDRNVEAAERSAGDSLAFFFKAGAVG